jgi:hypothetical protein
VKKKIIIKKNIIIMKTVLVTHPTNPNLMLEIDVPIESTTELIGGKKTKEKLRQKLEKEEILKKEKGEENELPLPPPPPPPPGANNDCLSVVPELYDFVGMLANALSMHGHKSLLADPTKSWYEQKKYNDLCDGLKINDNKINDNEWNEIARHVFSADTYGGMLRSYRSLTQCIERGITMRELITSNVTNANFAELVAAMTRQGAGGSAQPGRFYGGANQKNPSRWAYNIHAGIQFQQKNAKQIAYLKIWFTAIQKQNNSNTLYYTTPNVPKSIYGFY